MNSGRPWSWRTGRACPAERKRHQVLTTTRELLIQFFITLPALLVSLVFHELAHGYVSWRLGDPTAKRSGRLTLNPVKHLDPLGTLVLFITFFGSGGGMLFGWAKPVPVNPCYFKSPRHGMALVGLAGPATNLVLASAAALLLNVWVFTDELVFKVILLTFMLNLVLMVFNLIPVPPLDGSRVVGAFMDQKTYIKWARLDQYGMIFMMVLLLVMINTSLLSGIMNSLYKLFLPRL